jgi:hypothetical protein
VRLVGVIRKVFNREVFEINYAKLVNFDYFILQPTRGGP